MQLFRWQKSSPQKTNGETERITIDKNDSSETDFRTSVNVLYESFKTYMRLQSNFIVSTAVRRDAMLSECKYPDKFEMLHYGSKDDQSVKVGSGQYAKVYACGRYAYKIVKTGYVRGKEDIGILRCNLKELCFLHSLDHPNILKAHQSQCIMEHGYFKKLIHQMPYAKTTLGNIIDSNEILCYSEFWILFKGIAEGLAYLHRNNISHGDIKPSNIMIHEGKALIGDFTLTTIENRGKEMSFGSLYWRAPETLRQIASGPPADIWAFGIMILDCLYGCYYMRDVLEADDNMELLSKLKYIIELPHDSEPTFDEAVIQRIQRYEIQMVLSKSELTPLQDLLSRILVWDPAHRLSFADILKHPFFQAQDIGQPQENGQPQQPGWLHGYGQSTPSLWSVPEKVWHIYWRDESEKETLTKSAKYIYYDTFHTIPATSLDWMTTEIIFLTKRLIDHLKAIQVTFNTTEITKYAAYFFYFLYLDFYPEDFPQFESILFHILHLLQFNLFMLKPMEQFLDQNKKIEDTVIRVPTQQGIAMSFVDNSDAIFILPPRQ